MAGKFRFVKLGHGTVGSVLAWQAWIGGHGKFGRGEFWQVMAGMVVRVRSWCG